MRKQPKRIINLTTIVFLLFALIIGTFDVFVFAESETDSFGNDTEWWNFRNTETNNAVTERPTPTNDQEAWGKWAVRFGNDYSNQAPTPPIIINNKLYVGAGNKIYEVNKETGAIIRESEELTGPLGYAMQSPVYADGKIFIAISQGRICAVDIDDLTVAWTTDNSNIIRGQTVSPISYKKIGNKGYVYTGTWTKAGGDLICADTDDWNADKDYIDAEGNKIKRLTWCFNPMVDDAEGLAEYNADKPDEANQTVAVGYYWTGAYVAEKYLAIGSDNGSEMGDEVNDTAFYTLNPLTGEIIDRVYGIKGQVRSTVVFDNGYLFFTTKGGKVYKIKVDDEGYLSDVSFIDMQEYGVLMTTATPVVHNGKIYLGVQGLGNQFSADGGHGFVVARNDTTLNQNSFLYNIPVPGYPQAGALLSTYHEDEDFNADAVPDGRVYLFFTYNTFPGGIFYTYDTPDQLEPVALSVEEARIFVPTGDKQQHCISSIVVDREGNLYYKNDSCYLFCVESNPAGINGIQVLSGGSNIELNRPFHTKIPEYSCTVSGTTNKALIKLDLSDGVTATVDGENYVNNGVEIDLNDEVTEISIVSTKLGKSRYYTVTITKESSNANLIALASNYANSPSNFRPMQPEQLTQDVLDYEFNWRASGPGSSPVLPEKKMMNIYLKPENSKSTVLVLPGENTKSGGANYYDANGYVRPATVNSNKYSLRFPIYSADVTKDSTATIKVIAQDGVTTKTYNITFSRRIYVTNVTLNTNNISLHTGESVSLNAIVNPSYATNSVVEWLSTDENVATVDDNGLVTYVGAGTAIIRASTEDGPYDECQIVATNHYLNAYPEKNATCTSPGHEAYWRCSECGKYFADAEGKSEIEENSWVIPATGHTPQEAVHENVVDATCTTAGSYDEVVRCETCHVELSRTPRTITASGHKPLDAGQENVVPATCITAGSYDEVVRCETCGEVISSVSRVIPAGQHNLIETKAKAAICTQDGNNAYWTCSGCGKFFADDEGKSEIEENSWVIPATGHTPQEAVRENEVFALCDVDGSYDEVVYCETCHVELSRTPRTIAALGHKPLDAVQENAVDATCTTAGSYDEVVRCETCHVELSRTPRTIAALGHKPLDAVQENVLDATCTTTGSYDEVVRCGTCGEVISSVPRIIPATGQHNLIETKAKTETCTKAGNKAYWTCGTCKKVFRDSKGTNETTVADMVINAKGHNHTKTSAKDATCEKAGNKEYWTCGTCKKVFSDAKALKETTVAKMTLSKLGHKYGAWTNLNATQHQRVCANDKKHIEKSNHTWDAGKVTKKATCGAAGVKIYTCTVCKATKTETIKATGNHTWDAGKVTKQPTTTATGVKTFTCTVCKATRTETIAKLPIKDPALRRIHGTSRFKTSFAIAETYMKETNQTKLNSIIVASSITFPDALAGSYLAKAKNAPIIIWHEQLNKDVQTFIKQKVKPGGTVYILGGTIAVGESIKQNMGGYKFVRLADTSRYGTNLKILDNVGLSKAEVLVCDGGNDGKGINALIASATGRPLLLVDKNGLIPIQKTWLGKNKGKITKFVIVGDGKSVSAKVENELKAYGAVTRISGKNGDEVSANVASTYYKNAKEIFIATMDDYPDGLCGGPLAIFSKGPILLVNAKTNAASVKYAKTLTDLTRANILGGDKALPETLARKVAKNTKAKVTELKK